MDTNIISLSQTKTKVVDSQSNTTATATHTGVTRQRFYVTGITISASAAPAAAVTATVKDGSTVIDQVEIPAAAFAPIRINYMRPLECAAGNDAVATLPALGSGVVGTITLHGFSVQD